MSLMIYDIWLCVSLGGPSNVFWVVASILCHNPVYLEAFESKLEDDVCSHEVTRWLSVSR